MTLQSYYFPSSRAKKLQKKNTTSLLHPLFFSCWPKPRKRHLLCIDLSLYDLLAKKGKNLLHFLVLDTFFKFAYLIFLSILPLFLFQAIPLYIHWINKEYIPQIDIHPIFKRNFCSVLAKIALKLQNICFSLDSYCMTVPELLSDQYAYIIFLSPAIVSKLPAN